MADDTGTSTSTDETTTTTEETQQTPKTYTKAELDAMLQKQQAKIRREFLDYGELKEKAAELDTLREASKTEADKLRERHDRAIRERDAALESQRETRIRTAIVREAARMGATDPDDVAALVDRSDVSIEGDKVEGVEDAVKLLLGRKPYLFNRGSRRAGAELQGTEKAAPTRIARSQIRAWAHGEDGGLTAERQKQIDEAYRAGRIDADR